MLQHEQPNSDRRAFLAALGAGLALGPVSRALAQAPSGGPAPVPAVPAQGAAAMPGPSADGFTVLEARKGEVQLRPAPKPATAVWGYDGRVPGPVLRVRRGEEVKVRLVNRLDQPTTIHWHGVRGPNSMDGVAGLTQPAVPPGGSFEYRFAAPDAGTFWFHPHVPEHLSEQIERGLSGLLIVDEAAPPPVDCDIVAIIDDWRLDPEGALTADFGSAVDAAGAGRLGNLLTVNGRPGAHEESLPPRGRARVRLVNVANARALGVRVEGGTTRIVAVDGQPSSTAFEPKRGAFLLPPGGRVDLMIDLPAEGGGARVLAMLGEAAVPLVALTPAGERRAPLPPIAPLPPSDLPERLDLARAQRFELAIEGVAPGGAGGKVWRLATRGADAKPLFSVKRGTHVVVAFANRTKVSHAMHWHGHHARVLFTFDDGWDPFWQDTIIVPAGVTTRIVFRADNPGRWALTSSVPEHLAAGLAGWFEVA